ncbi:hypothetical protein [Deinococcus alpinitundrae]|nr:hypothetical protein [Deinococcus alpinitundrae]
MIGQRFRNTQIAVLMHIRANEMDFDVLWPVSNDRHQEKIPASFRRWS